MTDAGHFVYPKSKKGKSWKFDISDSNTISGINVDVPMGKRSGKIFLEKSYTFRWNKSGVFYFLMLRGS